jgi:hypothetical protein
MLTLLTAAVSVAFFHSLAPDHWLPFVAMAKGSRWPMSKLAWVTLLAGIGHVSSSILLGMIGLWAGIAIHHLEGAEAWRGSVGVWLLIGFGVAYALWGFKHAQHPHPHLTVQDIAKTYAARRVWMLIAIMVFGPCEPLIPLMFLAVQHGMQVVVATSLVFSIVTVAMVMGQSMLSYAGVRLINTPWMGRYAHALAGVSIVLTALFVLMTGV